jgi:hypothetical protein
MARAIKVANSIRTCQQLTAFTLGGRWIQPTKLIDRERRFGFIEGVGDQYATLFPVTHPQI